MRTCEAVYGKSIVVDSESGLRYFPLKYVSEKNPGVKIGYMELYSYSIVYGIPIKHWKDWHGKMRAIYREDLIKIVCPDVVLD